MDGLKQRRPDSNLVMDDEVRLSEQALPAAEPFEATLLRVCHASPLRIYFRWLRNQASAVK